VDADCARRHQVREPFGPLDHGDPVGPECLVQTEVGGLGRVVDPVQIEVLDRRRSVVALAKDEGWARDGYIAPMQRPDQGSNEGGFARTKAAGQRERGAGNEGQSEPGSDRIECIPVEKIEDVRGHALPFDERISVLVRASDVVVGIIAGAVCAVVSAAFEGGILAFRFFTIDPLGAHFGAEFAIFALAGAAIGGLVAFGAGAGFLREPVTP
jgi:hypothetical protein